MVGAIVREQTYLTCPSRESNPGRLIYRQTLYHVAVKAVKMNFITFMVNYVNDTQH